MGVHCNHECARVNGQFLAGMFACSCGENRRQPLQGRPRAAQATFSGAGGESNNGGKGGILERQ